MSRNSLRAPVDHPRVSTVVMLVALAVAVASVFVAPGFNGLSLVAVILVFAALGCRLLEGRTRP
jgi:hypothetical protein